ncbi:nickel pincer cofactor biosynthesis protein LarC [Intrasporangium calvum]|uniref:nickel pincer cofactor biosynthesis protein LarC n=1 Tax=Intrasporangium calvum TaxID=53358 RepID=UPI000DF5FA24|nr:nickel pincer cofactor biosynthesis protein LarC [Intrasporangium calvum]AXG13946.1 nickel pincer cofactor biosynthesis protein LarC [Intrasporangium calvum]
MPETPPTSLDRPGSVLWIDASAGVAGDMLLGALVDAGASLDRVRAAVEAVIPRAVRIRATETVRAGMRAVKVDVESAIDDQPHRTWAEVERLVRGAELPQRVVDRAHAVFEALARVEAQVHGVPVADVHFHEVGAWDSIADVVGVCAALEDLAVSEVVASVIAVGSGSVHGAHGRIPVPVPAVLGLAVGWVLDAVGDGELATPTGVALVTTLASGQGPLPKMELTAVGAGAGGKDVEGRANVVRAVLGRAGAAAPAESDTESDTESSTVPAELEQTTLTVLEANVDDLDPRVWPSVLASLFDAGAADAWLTPILMKKGRPAHTLSVLGRREDEARLRDLVLTLTSTIGVRRTIVDRWALPRQWVDVDVEGRRVGIKVAHREGRVVQATPELADVEAAATALERPVRVVLDAAVAAAAAAGLTPGATL